jgi:hypothetical protein
MFLNDEERKLASIRLESNMFALSKLSKEQIESLVRLAKSYNPERMTFSTDIWSNDNILFMIGTAGLSGLIEDDGSVHT